VVALAGAEESEQLMPMIRGVRVRQPLNIYDGERLEVLAYGQKIASNAATGASRWRTVLFDRPDHIGDELMSNLQVPGTLGGIDTHDGTAILLNWYARTNTIQLAGHLVASSNDALTAWANATTVALEICGKRQHHLSFADLIETDRGALAALLDAAPALSQALLWIHLEGVITRDVA
jgi:hypothetical protein